MRDSKDDQNCQSSDPERFDQRRELKIFVEGDAARLFCVIVVSTSMEVEEDMVSVSC